jgi:hypothetical protein
MKLTLVVCALLTLTACGDDPAWIGTYASSGSWDISGPLAGGRTVGDAVADLLVDKIVGLSGVPSPLEDKAHELTDKAIRAHVKSAVDGNAPTELAPGGQVAQLLASSLAKVKVESTITLEEGLLPGSMEGKEDVTSLTYEHEGKAYTLDAAKLAGAGVSIEAEWEGDEGDGETLDVDQHPVKIRFGELVRRVAEHAVDASGQDKLKNDVVSAVSCDQIVKLILGSSTGLKISVSDWSTTVDSGDLKSACGAAALLLQSRVLGLFALDTKIEKGGSVSYSGGNPASSLKSGAGFGGIVNVAPRPIAPRVIVEFSATRN